MDTAGAVAIAGAEAATVMSGVAADDAMAAVTVEEVPVAIAAAEAATVMSGVAADDAMAAVTVEEVPVAIAGAEAGYRNDSNGCAGRCGA